MAKAAFNLDKVRQEILNSSLARTNRFEVIINPPLGLSGDYKSDLISMYVEQSSMPSLNIFTKSYKIFGPSYQRPISSEYGGEGISFVFHVDRDMKVRKFFEDWMHLIVNPSTFTVGYQSSYTAEVLIRQLDEQENITHEVRLIDAFPRNLNLMDLNNASSETHRLNILFAYRYWENTGVGITPVSDSRALQYPQVPTSENISHGASLTNKSYPVFT